MLHRQVNGIAYEYLSRCRQAGRVDDFHYIAGRSWHKGRCLFHLVQEGIIENRTENSGSEALPQIAGKDVGTGYDTSSLPRNH